jgi:LacI family transcriptional regulator
MYDLETERNNIQTVLARIPDCVVISPVSIHSENLVLLKNMYSRTVILSQIFEDIPANYVKMDHRHGGYISAIAMLNKGHRQNIIFTEPPEYPSSAEFLKGVQQAYIEYGISFDEVTLIYGTPSLEVGYEGIIDLYRKNNKAFTSRFTGVIAFCDLLAFGVYQAAAKLGLHIPEDLSVIGYDDNPMAALAFPPLTTIFMPKEEISNYCSEILLSKLIDNDPTVRSYSLQPHLVERDSIKKLT